MEAVPLKGINIDYRETVCLCICVCVFIVFIAIQAQYLLYIYFTHNSPLNRFTPISRKESQKLQLTKVFHTFASCAVFVLFFLLQMISSVALFVLTH